MPELLGSEVHHMQPRGSLFFFTGEKTSKMCSKNHPLSRVAERARRRHSPPPHIILFSSISFTGQERLSCITLQNWDMFCLFFSLSIQLQFSFFNLSFSLQAPSAAQVKGLNLADCCLFLFSGHPSIHFCACLSTLWMAGVCWSLSQLLGARSGVHL